MRSQNAPSTPIDRGKTPTSTETKQDQRTPRPRGGGQRRIALRAREGVFAGREDEMTYRPRHPKPDANQRRILAEIAQIPFLHAWNISKSSDDDCPGDILVYDEAADICRPFEIKTKAGRVSSAQFEMSRFVPIVHETEDILRWFGRL